MELIIRKATKSDLTAILQIYNQGIEDRVATLEEEQKDAAYITNWFAEHEGRFSVMVAEMDGVVCGWASLNRYSQRCAYNGVADLSIYIARDYRGNGIGQQLLAQVEEVASQNEFYKIVLFTFALNHLGQGLYRKSGYREVGVFEKQGILDGKPIDVMIMEKLL
ncbi:arsinothricin resistance N-acetyltransferase ArsN1 family A [Paenibacillus agri]|uniref:N-acetyltransferase family protein n=1 Tax=Paenibacillus agri TaxID=2744309 RepID=A0A850EKH5_9BACL|nr:arsinothricin resistance N-acetyltransferase ArsN1 family A [Paenibacillus agri]NUU59957.1 N-acetyltransferase family protein [Paenibacillus agri]